CRGATGPSAARLSSLHGILDRQLESPIGWVPGRSSSARALPFVPRRRYALDTGSVFTGSAMMAAATYYTNIGPKSGPIRHRDGLDAIGALESRDNHTPIGMALGWYWDAEGRAAFKLIVHGAQIPGSGLSSIASSSRHWDRDLVERCDLRHPVPASG